MGAIINIKKTSLSVFLGGCYLTRTVVKVFDGMEVLINARGLIPSYFQLRLGRRVYYEYVLSCLNCMDKELRCV